MKRSIPELFILAMASMFIACSNPATGTDAKQTITLMAIPGVIAPVYGAIPVTTAINTAQYTGTIAWDPTASPFAATTVYAANIELTAKTGWTLNGVVANGFTVAGAAATNAANSGYVTAVFPKTGGASEITYADLMGTWSGSSSFTRVTSSPDPEDPEGPVVSTEYDCTAIIKLIIADTGDYVEIATVTMTTTEEPIATTLSYEASKGTMSLSGGGDATWNETETAVSSTPLVDPIAWSSFISVETDTIVLIDGKLYIDSAYRRVGAGTEITGTWVKDRYRLYDEAAHYYRTTIGFTDTTMTFMDEVSDDGITYSISGTPGSFSITRNTDSSISTAGGKMYYLLSGDWFVFGDDTASDCEGWIKE